jgi:hypothetical protein
MRKGRRLLVSQFLPLGRFPPSRPRSAVSMKTNEIARLILPEWGVPSGLIYSGCGMSLPPTSSNSLGTPDGRIRLIIRCNGSYDGYFCYFSSRLRQGMSSSSIPLPLALSLHMS